MSKPIKRIISINDLSVFGKCSQTVSVPVLSAMGIEVCPVITAYLSAHTAFDNPVITDMSESLEACLSHLSKLGVESDCVFTGYVYKPGQFETIKKYVIEKKQAGNLIVTDPVMADNGELYHPFDGNTVKKMRELCLFSDVITPNFTEACFLAGLPVIDSVDQKKSDALIARLNTLGINGRIVITGVPYFDGTKKIINGFNDKAEIIDCDYVDGEYCGTGDVFSALLCGYLVNGETLYDSIIKSRDFVYKAVSETKRLSGSVKQGIVFEKYLNELV